MSLFLSLCSDRMCIMISIQTLFLQCSGTEWTNVILDSIHLCEKLCHEGSCGPCSLTSTIRCRCGSKTKAGGSTSSVCLQWCCCCSEFLKVPKCFNKLSRFSGGSMCYNPNRGWGLWFNILKKSSHCPLSLTTIYLFLLQLSLSSPVRSAATRNVPAADTSAANCVVW